MPAPTELLQRVPLFSDLDRRELDGVASSMKERVFKPGETIAEEGKGGVGFFVIETGEATVSVQGDKVRTLKEGDYFGEVALIADVERTATVTADTELRCWGMTFWDFRPLVESNASIAWKLLQVMGKRLQEAQRTS